MRFHDYANIFPMMGESEFEALKADIKENGQKDPIYIYRECVLDGRNRWKACTELHIKPITQPYFGTDALGFVLSKNLHRRHLNESQRALIGAELLKRGKEVVLPIGKSDLNTNKGNMLDAISEQLNVSPRSIARADKILDSGNHERIDAVRNGKAKVSEPSKPKRIKVKLSDYDIAIKAVERLDEMEVVKLWQEIGEKNNLF